MKIEFLRVQEQICALSGKLSLYFASPEWEQRSFVSSSPYANVAERETLLKGTTSFFTSSSFRHEFLLSSGAINLGKCPSCHSCREESLFRRASVSIDFYAIWLPRLIASRLIFARTLVCITSRRHVQGLRMRMSRFMRGITLSSRDILHATQVD